MRFANAMDLNWDGDNWTGKLRLHSWRDFQSRHGAYGGISSSEPSDGIVTLVLGPEGRGPEAPNAEEEGALLWLLKNESAVQRSMLGHLKGQYPSLQEQYAYSDEEAVQFMPSIRDEDDFKQLIGLHSVYVHPLTREGLPYIGFEFGCTWDGEHGLGFMMHGDRVVDSGGADTSFLLWIAEKDAEEA